MSTTMTHAEFTALRAEFPDASPAALYDVACVRLSVPATWATVPWIVCAMWMDMFATVNPLSSMKVH